MGGQEASVRSTVLFYFTVYHTRRLIAAVLAVHAAVQSFVGARIVSRTTCDVYTVIPNCPICKHESFVSIVTLLLIPVPGRREKEGWYK